MALQGGCVVVMLIFIDPDIQKLQDRWKLSRTGRQAVQDCNGHVVVVLLCMFLF